MANVDIPVGPALQRALDLPPCADISLPSPSPLKVQLPSGTTLSAINDLSRGVPTDCSMSFSLMLQLGPLLAALDCPLKMLKVLEPLLDVIGALPGVPPVEAVEKLGKAVEELVPCFLAVTPAGMLPFVRDILRLIAKVLHCLIGQLKTIVGLMSGIQLRLADAEEAGNAELADALRCAQDNAKTSAGQLTQAIEPVSALLGLMGTVFAIAQLDPIAIPALGDAGDAEALNGVIQVLEDVVAAIQTVVGD